MHIVYGTLRMKLWVVNNFCRLQAREHRCWALTVRCRFKHYYRVWTHISKNCMTKQPPIKTNFFKSLKLNYPGYQGRVPGDEGLGGLLLTF